MFRDWLVLSFLFWGLAILLLAAAQLLRYALRQEERYPGHAEARVVDIRNEPRSQEAALSEFRNRQVAVFEYFADGKLVKVVDEADTYPCPYHMNQKVRICYNPDDPMEYEVEPYNRKRVWGSILHGLGLVFAFAGCILFLLYAAGISLM
jgi:hypothetical protein